MASEMQLSLLMLANCTKLSMLMHTIADAVTALYSGTAQLSHCYALFLCTGVGQRAMQIASWRREHECEHWASDHLIPGRTSWQFVRTWGIIAA